MDDIVGVEKLQEAAEEAVDVLLHLMRNARSEAGFCCKNLTSLGKGLCGPWVRGC